MTEITLRYNPFEAKAIYEYTGKNKSIPKCMGTGENSRLQDWLYDFFPNLKEMHNWGEGSKCTLSFDGTPEDFEDIEHAAEVFKKDNPGIEIIPKHLNPKSKKLGNRLSDLRAIFEKIQQESPYEELKAPELKPRFEQAVSSEFEISVIATMSSGKSTLINALLGQEILPARNEATTAKIAQIHDVDGMKGFAVQGLKKDYNGDYLPATEEKPATLEEIETLNSSNAVDKIEITGDIPGINSREMRLLLSDTPGPNNSRSIDHAKHIDELIKADYKPMIMYILNATQLEINDDKSLLEKIAKAMMEGKGKQIKDRFLFVLNKADQLDPGKNEFVEKKVADSKDYLERQFGITGARIFPVSAQLAKIIRMSQAGRKLTEDEEDFLAKKNRYIERKERHFSDYVSLSPSCKKRQEEILENAKAAKDENTQALVYSGIIALELAMDEYLEKYALTEKISKAVGSFNHLIERLNLSNNTRKELADNTKAREKVASELEKLRKHIENGSEAKKLKDNFDRDIISIKKELEVGFKKHENSVNKMMDGEAEKFGVDIDAGEKKEKMPIWWSSTTDSPEETELEISKKKAKGIIETTKKNMQLQYEILASDLADMFDKELKGQANKYLDEYQGYISGLMNTDGYTMSATLNLINVAIPDNADDLLDRFSGTETETKIVRRHGGNPDKAWYKPWTWFDDHYHEWDEEVKSERHVIKMQSLFEQSIEPQFQQFFKMIENVRKTAEKNAQGLKDFFTKEITRLDNAVKEAIREEEKSVQSQEAIEQKIKETKAKAEWLNGIIAKLKAIREV